MQNNDTTLQSISINPEDYYIVAVTGHRPDKLGGYKAYENFRILKEHMSNFLYDMYMTSKKPVLALSGGALGIDRLWIEAALDVYIRVVAALPFDGYDSTWPPFVREAYKKLLDKCKTLHISTPGYTPNKLQLRNQWLVDNSNLLVAYWNNSIGGTANCVKYARAVRQDITIFNTNELLNLASPEPDAQNEFDFF